VSQKTSILNYILLDAGERARLGIVAVPQSHPQRAIRAPVPWAETKEDATAALKTDLFAVGRIPIGLHSMWINEFDTVRFVDAERIKRAVPPPPLRDFITVLNADADAARVVLRERWVQIATDVVLEHADEWTALLGDGKTIAGYARLERLFQSAATLMSNELRGTVMASLADLRALFARHVCDNP
jgi:dynein heavy chain